MLINRQGKIIFVISGSAHEIEIPSLSDFRVDSERLRGLRLLHTHLAGEELTHDDLTDLAILKLDLMAAIEVTSSGLPGKIHCSHINSGTLYTGEEPWTILPSEHLSNFKLKCDELISSIENELSRFHKDDEIKAGHRAILIDVTKRARVAAEEDMEELKELARTNGIEPVTTKILRPHQKNRKILVGQGQLKELALLSLSKRADTLLFNQNLTPSQSKQISDSTDLFIMDRTQLILDIFGQRALTHDGKTKVELAQLKYALPRLTAKDDSLSRIRGGIGLKGPGETKMEIGRRTIQDRISSLEKKLLSLSKGRSLRKQARIQSSVNLISIVGYTNSGKSTLLNALTGSNALVEDKLFATLDPTSRALNLPGNKKAIISDTVGFIKNLPPGLLDAFRSTLEEINDADLIIHLADIKNPNFQININVVEEILNQLKLNHITVINVLNKVDGMDEEMTLALCNRHSAIPISAKTKYNLDFLCARISERLEDK